MFAPDFGIIEDPATGSASRPLGCYLVQHGAVKAIRRARFKSARVWPWDARAGSHVSVEGAAEDITGVKVGGKAVLVGRGELLV